MDTLTHALSGALLVRAVASIRLKTPSYELPLRHQVVAGFAAAAFPDIDFFLRLVDTLTYLSWHQGPTHSIVMLPLWAWLLSCLFSWFSRGRYRWQLFYVPVCLGIAIHIVGDLITSYGLMLFAPFSTQRFFIPLVFVIDPWITLIIATGLYLSWKFPQRRVFAVCALSGLVGYLTVLLVSHGSAMKIGQSYITHSNMSADATVDVLPQPLSPFNWKIIIRQGEAYSIALVNLWPYQKSIWSVFDGGLMHEMASAYQPISTIDWQQSGQFGDDLSESSLVREAWFQPEFAQFRAFAAFPRLEQINDTPSGSCAWFYDLRFEFPSLSPSFRYGMCLNKDSSEWVMQRQRGAFWID